METTSKQWGLNGVGRIGREVLAQNARLNGRERTTEKPGGIQIRVINEPKKPLEQIVADIRRDLIHGEFPDVVVNQIAQGGNDYIYIQGEKVKITREREPAKAWEGEGLFGVMDASGQYRERAKAATHLEGTGVSHVLITAPSPDSDLSLVYGINDEEFKGQTIVDQASCTTKSALPVVQTLDREFGIEDADLETIHAATGKELRTLMDRMALNEAKSREEIMTAIGDGVLSLQDVDWILDEPTGAARNVTRILPNLEGKFRARAKRVASPNGSLSVMNFLFRRETNPDRIREALLQAVHRYPTGVLRTVPSMPSTEALNGMNDDSVVPLDRIEGRRMFKVVAGYSNEVGPSRSAVQTARLMQDWSPPAEEKAA